MVGIKCSFAPSLYHAKPSTPRRNPTLKQDQRPNEIEGSLHAIASTLLQLWLPRG
jgi:hypothetical protein